MTGQHVPVREVLYRQYQLTTPSETKRSSKTDVKELKVDSLFSASRSFCNETLTSSYLLNLLPEWQLSHA